MKQIFRLAHILSIMPWYGVLNAMFTIILLLLSDCKNSYINATGY